jgi:hypothetical protein
LRAYNESEISRLKESYGRIVSRWKRYKANRELEPKLKNITYWFSEENYYKLLKLKNAIYSLVENQDDLDFFRVVLADIIRPCSKSERQTLKPYISKKYPKLPADVHDSFVKSFIAHEKALLQYSQVVGVNSSSIKWLGNDGTKINSKNNFIDVAITSPPYINALDYVRCIKLESSWVDCGDDDIFTELRTGHLGEWARLHMPKAPEVVNLIRHIVDRISEVDEKRAMVVSSYFTDMQNNLKSVFGVLRTGGRYHIIIGDSEIRNVRVETHKIIGEIAENVGFKWVGYYKYQIKDHRTSIPRNGRGGKIKFEHVVTLEKDK